MVSRNSHQRAAIVEVPYMTPRRFSSACGMVDCSLLNARFSTIKFSLPSEDGMVEEKRLLFNSRCVSLDCEPSDTGIEPVSCAIKRQCAMSAYGVTETLLGSAVQYLIVR